MSGHIGTHNLNLVLPAGVQDQNNWADGQGVLYIGNGSAAPTGPALPTNGGFLYVQDGALKYRGSSGTITTLGPA